MIHIGSSKTKMTLCVKSIARRWWVEAAHREYGIGPGRLRVYRETKPEGASCPKCLRKARA